MSKPAQKALEMMVENGAYANQLPEDFRAVIPQGTQIKSYKYDKEQKLATVEFSEPFTGLQRAGRAYDRRSHHLDADGYDLALKVLKSGMKAPSCRKCLLTAYPLDETLTRAVGINIEAAEGVNYAQSTPVTLYFSAQTLNDEQYYVPVTRLVARSSSPAQAALEQLISGPLNKKELTSVILPDVQVKNIVQEGDVVTVDLQDEAYQEGQKLPTEMLQALVLSVTENTGAATVQIKLNGEANVVDDGKPILQRAGWSDRIMSMRLNHNEIT